MYLYTEAEIIKGCIKNDKHFQKLLFDKYASKMLYVCIRYTKNKDEAQDVLQDGFIKIFKNIHTFKNNGVFEGWIRKVFVNCSLEFLRNKKRSIVFSDLDKSTNTVSTEGNLLSDINAKELHNLIAALPDGYRLIFNLYVIEGYSHKEIADMLHITEGTSKSQLAKARMRLQQSINSVFGVKD